MTPIRLSMLIAGMLIATGAASAQDQSGSLLQPYNPAAPWGSPPNGRVFGQVIGVYPDRDGKDMWVFERCGNRYCTDSPIGPVVELDPSGKVLRSIGAGLFVFPHGLWIDKDDNLWLTDADMKDGKGNQVFKLSPDGKVLMTLGKKGEAGTDEDHFDKPCDAVVGADGSIFVADGHGNSRIVKFSADGKFIKAWGQKGAGPGEFNTPHKLALDSAGRLFVADRGNDRIQIFDQDGKFLAAWKQFGRPSGIYIDKADVIYVTDSESNNATNPGFARGIRIGSAKDGTLTAFIPDANKNPPQTTGVGAGTGPEGIAADAAGNLYGGETTEKALVRYVKK